jgi:hypothetical protein
LISKNGGTRITKAKLLETMSQLEKGEVGFAPLNEEARRSWISGGLSVSSKVSPGTYLISTEIEAS